MINIIDSLEKMLFRGEYRKRESHYASDVSACRRQLFYKWREGDGLAPVRSNPPDASALIKMEIGNKLHDMIQDIFTSDDSPLVSHFEAEVKGEYKHPDLVYPIRARADGVFIDDDKMRCGAEIKTSYGRGIAEIARTRTPKPEHVDQCIITQGVLDLDRMYLVYLGRDNSYRCQFVFEYTGDEYVGSFVWEDGNVSEVYRHNKTWHDLIEQLVSVEAYLKSGKEPPRDFIVAIKNGEIRDSFQHQKRMYKSDWQCSYCSWRDHCWADIVREFADSNNAEDFEVRGMGESDGN